MKEFYDCESDDSLDEWCRRRNECCIRKHQDGENCCSSENKQSEEWCEPMVEHWVCDDEGKVVGIKWIDPKER